MAHSIDSSSSIPIDHPFRIEAGPGAGKTHWLVNHIKHVVHESNRLDRTRKIACITYTNIAVDTITKRLNGLCERVEVTTIHSFLYDAIVKPYIKFVRSDLLPLAEEMTLPGDDIILSYPILKEVMTKCRYVSKEELCEALPKAFWQLNSDDEIEYKPLHPYPTGRGKKKIYLSNQAYSIYKQSCLKAGYLSYDDINAIAYTLIRDNEIVATLVASRYPYIFIDEFQDTNPIQLEIIKKIAGAGSIIGVIGDNSQMIFGFQGVKPDTLKSFHVNGLVDYYMNQNRRSTKSIIDFLNSIRSDFTQIPLPECEIGEKPVLLIGSPADAYIKAQELSKCADVISLHRINDGANQLNKSINYAIKEDYIKKLRNIDSNDERRRTIEICAKALEYAIAGNYTKSQSELHKLSKDSDEDKKSTFIIMMTLLDNQAKVETMTLSDFRSFIDTNIIHLSSLRVGAIKTFYESTSYKDYSVGISLRDTIQSHITVHRAKGDEFDNVVYILQNENDLKFLTNTDLQNEEHRISYVAVSRAKKRLFINVPTLSQSNRKIIAALNLSIVDL